MAIFNSKLLVHQRVHPNESSRTAIPHPAAVRILEAEMRRRTVPNEARAFRPLARRGAGREGWWLGYPSGPSIQKWAVSWDRPSWEIQCAGHELGENWMDFCVISIWKSLFSDILASPAARWRKVRSTRTSFMKLSGLAVSHGVPCHQRLLSGAKESGVQIGSSQRNAGEEPLWDLDILSWIFSNDPHSHAFYVDEIHET